MSNESEGGEMDADASIEADVGEAENQVGDRVDEPVHEKEAKA
jgi:hypothetical protein